MRCFPSLFLLGLGACATASAPRPPPLDTTWLGKLDAHHPLVGMVWDVKAGRALEASALDARLAAARFVMLGEKHDNPDHHALQGHFVRRLTRAGRRPVLVFEMIADDMQTALRAASAAPGWSPEAVAEVVKWKGSGWPPFSEYRPIFEAASEAGLPLAAAGIPRATGMALARGTRTLPPEFRARHGLDSPLEPPLAQSLNEDLIRAHCGYMTEEMLPTMARVQRARDARMADAMLAAGGPAVLIAGGEHARPDRGVPWYLRRQSSDPLLAVRFVEVRAEDTDPAAYAKRHDGGFDLFVFTPRLRDVDYCAELEAKDFR